jgi:hypothetical protein
VINRRIAITPIHLDLTGRRLLRRLKTWSWEMPKDAKKSRAKASVTKPPSGDQPASVDREKKLTDEDRRERR